MNYKKIRVIGFSGSGKTYVSRFIAKKINADILELDGVFWKRKYDVPRQRGARKRIVRNFLRKHKSWVIEGGGLGTWSADTFDEADVILFLDSPFYLQIYHVIRRHIHRRISKSEAVDTVKGLLELIHMNYQRRRKDHPKNPLFAAKNHMKKLVIIKSKKQLKDFLEKL